MNLSLFIDSHFWNTLPKKEHLQLHLPTYHIAKHIVTTWPGDGMIYTNPIAMKAISVLLIFLLNAQSIWAGNSCPSDSNAKHGQTEFNFFENNFRITKKDSVLVIYDRYDRSGAGVIRKVYYPGKTQSIVISNIPSGKYFVTIQCLGKHHDRFDKIIKIKPGKTAYVSVKLRDYDEFLKDRVIIPADHIDFSKLTILQMK